jgi:hypothetical protein
LAGRIDRKFATDACRNQFYREQLGLALGLAPPERKLTIQERFELWLEAEPETWKLIRAYAYRYLDAWLKRENGRRIGIDLIVSRVRWEHDVERRSDEPFKVNNDFRSRMSRKLIEEDKRFGQLFEIREVKTP